MRLVLNIVAAISASVGFAYIVAGWIVPPPGLEEANKAVASIAIAIIAAVAANHRALHFRS